MNNWCKYRREYHVHIYAVHSYKQMMNQGRTDGQNQSKEHAIVGSEPCRSPVYGERRSSQTTSWELDLLGCSSSTATWWRAAHVCRQGLGRSGREGAAWAAGMHRGQWESNGDGGRTAADGAEARRRRQRTAWVAVSVKEEMRYIFAPREQGGNDLVQGSEWQTFVNITSEMGKCK
jgi:hypothetical protein